MLHNNSCSHQVLKKLPNKFNPYIHFVTIPTLSSLLCSQQPASGCSKININIILPFMTTCFKSPLLFKLKDQDCICINLHMQTLTFCKCVTWVENSDLCKNYYCYISWHFTQTHSHPYLTMVSKNMVQQTSGMTTQF